MVKKKRFILFLLFFLLIAVMIIYYFNNPLSESTIVPAQESITVLYKQNCAGCHGIEGRGTVRGVQLFNRNFHEDFVKATILQGSARMPKFNIPEPYLTDLARYVVQIK